MKGLLRRAGAASPLSRTIDLEDPCFSADPYAFYETLRGEGSVLHLPRHGFWIVLGYQAAKDVFASPDRFSSAPYEFIDRALLSADPPRHASVRRIVSCAFSGEALRRAEQLAAEVAQKSIRARMEVVSGFARPISRAVAADLIGFDEEALGAIVQVEDEAEASHAPDGFNRICEVLDALAPTAGMFARFSQDGALEADEARSLVRLLWLASSVTTERTLSHAILHLLEAPALYQRLKESPQLLPSFVEEVVRLNPPENLIRRRAVAATALAGKPIPAGAEVNICLPAANRDPVAFDAPAELRLKRSGGSNLSFGSGIHHCVGGPMTRRVMAAALEVFLHASQAPRLDGELRWLHAMMVRAPRELWIST